MIILPGITGLLQHLNAVKTNLNSYRPKYCPNCGKAYPWIHGCYERKPDRHGDSTNLLNGAVAIRTLKNV